MREIESKKEIERKRRRNQWIIGGILVVVMLGSTFGYAFYQLGGDKTNVNKVRYNGYDFTNNNDFWTTTIGSYNFIFTYNPTQIEKVETANLSYLNSYSGKTLYISSEDNLAGWEIQRDMEGIAQRIQGACPENTNCTEDWPTKDCSNNFIIIKKANESKIYQNQSCVFIEGKEENLTQVTDEFLFKITGIES